MSDDIKTCVVCDEYPKINIEKGSNKVWCVSVNCSCEKMMTAHSLTQGNTLPSLLHDAIDIWNNVTNAG